MYVPSNLPPKINCLKKRDPDHIQDSEDFAVYWTQGQFDHLQKETILLCSFNHDFDGDSIPMDPEDED